MTTVLPDVTHNPYPGLRPYEREQYESFFGRDQQIDDLLVRLRDHRFVAVVGLSGSGKSSLVRAGLIHKLDVGHLTSAGSRWRVAVFRPGSKPIDALAAALGEALDANGDCPAERLRESTRALLRHTRKGRSPEENLLLVVDQFEEVFRFQKENDLSPREAAHFVDLLLAVEQDLSPEYRLYVVLTMRSDALGEVAQFEGLPEVLNRSQYLVPRMTRDQMQEAIVGPAALTDTTIAPDVLQGLLAEAAQGQDQLPLLQHLLMRLWEKRRPTDDGGWQITTAEFETLGGPAEALDEHADQVFAQLQTEEHRNLARLMFQQLTEISQGREQRRPARLSKLADLTGGSPEEVRAVAEHFFSASLLTSPDRGRADDWEVDITHECLIRQWTELRDWVRAEAADREEFLDFAKKAERRHLLSGTDLDLALRWRKKDHTAAWAERYGGDLRHTLGFIDRSRRARVAWRLIGAAAAVVVAIAGYRFVEALDSESRLQDALLFARVDWASDPLTKAQLLAELGNPADAARLEPYLRLFQDVATTAIPRAVLRTQNSNALRGVGFGADGRVVTVDAAGMLRKWSADGKGLSEDVELSPNLGGKRCERRADPSKDTDTKDTDTKRDDDAPLCAKAVEFSADHQWVAVAFGDGTIRLGPTGAAGLVDFPPFPEQKKRAGLRAIALSRTGRRLASGGGGHGVEIWGRREDGSLGLEWQLGGDISGLDFDSHESRLVTASSDGVIRVWGMGSGGPEIEIGPIRATSQARGLGLLGVTFSPDDQWLMGWYDDGTARIWRSDGKGAPLILQPQEARVTSAWFSPRIGQDSSLIVGTASDDQTARLWTLRVEPGMGLQMSGPPTLLMGHTGVVVALAFSADGMLLATASDDGSARVWWTEPQEPRMLGRHGSVVESVSFNASGTRLVTASRDNTARVWTLDDSVQPHILEGHKDWVTSAVFSPVDDSQVATGSWDKQLGLWDLDTGKSKFLNVQAALLAVAFSPDGTRLAAASDDRQARIWHVTNSTLDQLISLTKQGDWVFDVSFSPNSRQILTASGDGYARLWSLTGALDQQFQVSAGQDRRVQKAVFSPNGARIATASGNAVRVWQPTGSQELAVIRHSRLVTDVAFQPPEGEWILTTSVDRTARISGLRSGSAPRMLRSGTSVRSGAFDATGRYVATGGDDGSVRLWRIAPTDLVDYLTNATTACLSALDRETFLREAHDEARSRYESCERRYARVPK